MTPKISAYIEHLYSTACWRTKTFDPGRSLSTCPQEEKAVKFEHLFLVETIVGSLEDGQAAHRLRKPIS
jgi:hypothetical protein